MGHKLEEKVIGMTNWYSEIFHGVVIGINLSEVDPLHDYLININDNYKLSIKSKSEFEAVENSLNNQEDIFISKELITSFTAKKLNKIKKAQQILKSQFGKKYLNYESEIYAIFNSTHFLLKLRLRFWWMHLKLGILFLVNTLIVSPIEMLFTDLIAFAKSKNQITGYKEQLENKKYSLQLIQNISHYSGISYTDIEKEIQELEKVIQDKESHKVAYGRSFLILILSIFGTLFTFRQIRISEDQNALIDNQSQIMQNQYEMSVQQQELSRAIINPKFYIRDFYNRDENTNEIVSEGLLIDKNENYAINLSITQFSILSTKKLERHAEPVVYFYVNNYYSSLTQSFDNPNQWVFNSSDNIQIMKSYNEMLAGRTIDGIRIEPLTIEKYLRVSYKNQIGEELVDYFKVDDLQNNWLPLHKGENLFQEYLQGNIVGIHASLQNELSYWIEQNCD
jgi:hypothetical protein